MRVWVGVAIAVVLAAQLGCTVDVDGSREAGVSRFESAAESGITNREGNFGLASPSPDTRQIVGSILQTHDNAGAAFIVLDKKAAELYVFDGEGLLRGESPVLLGLARGDTSVPGIGERPIQEVLPHERTTPAGRFVAERGKNLSGEDVVWVDYDAAVSMHRVRATNAKERRLERLATPTADDNRISYGCINIPKTFYDTVILPVVARQRVVVYVLPEVKSMQEVFNFYRLIAKI